MVYLRPPTVGVRGAKAEKKLAKFRVLDQVPEGTGKYP